MSANDPQTVREESPEHASESDVPFKTKCQHCGTVVETKIVRKVGAFAWTACILLASFGFFLGCCLVPFRLESAKDIVHICNNCQKEIGRYSKF